MGLRATQPRPYAGGAGEALLPSDPQGGPAPAILRGESAKLDPQQQEVIIVGVTKWLKDRSSARFGPMQVVRDPRGPVVVCGWIDGHNGAGAYRGMSPYIGVLMGPRNDAEFLVVGIGATARERAEVLSLCAEVGVTSLKESEHRFGDDAQRVRRSRRSAASSRPRAGCRLPSRPAVDL